MQYLCNVFFESPNDAKIAMCDKDIFTVPLFGKKLTSQFVTHAKQTNNIPFYFFSVNAMYPAVFPLAVNPHLGRVDKSVFSDQSLMEMLIDGFDEGTKQRYKDDEGMYLDVCEWDCVECDDSERVVEICEIGDVSGSLQLCYIPPKVQIFDMSRKELTGSIDITQISDDIKQLYLHGNHLTGSVDLTKLPESSTDVYLQNNQCSGSINLTKLPASMNDLDLSHNQFSGSIDLTRLPQRICTLRLSVNRLSGSVCLSKLPEKIFNIAIDENAFTGSFIAKNLPPNLGIIYANKNQFSEKAVIDAQTGATVDLQKSGVTSVVDENGNLKVKGVIL